MFDYRIDIWGVVESFMLIVVMAIPIIFLIWTVVYLLERLKQVQTSGKENKSY
ncbi:hypothetical protein [Clostridium formicaceticum]|uniref:Uncharacterized protein n=1 Tax=Clostridium formicaceticum TaxID=1497 RepID=A0AAC9WGX7_9CLOT|nr:hypothetical protein [Clostridium formicaceticum]ARE88351.1 hypothetical protein CLFO_27520 [Clostridium formicaceticum]